MEFDRERIQIGLPRLSLHDIKKSFGAVCALEGVSFDVQAAHIHALVGENGAGKSTLVKVITGLEQPDTGHVRLDGVPCRFRTPMEARAAGVTAVYQDPKLFPHLDVAENIFMGIYPTSRFGMVDRRAMYAEAERLLTELGMPLDPRSLIAGFSVAELQFVEIVRAISTEVKVLILDEPTAALTPSEADRLFQIVRQLREGGTSIILISHRLEEITEMADTVTVLRDGSHITTQPASSLSEEGIVQLMVGRSLQTFFARADKDTSKVQEERLRVENLCQQGVFENVSFEVHAGEIVGMAGLVGAGRSEIAQTLFGITPPTAGRVVLNGQEVTVKNPHQMLGLGMAYLPEDRDGQGLVTALSITTNITLPVVSDLARLGMLQPQRENALAQQMATDLEIKAGSLEQAVASLSGGNRQKTAFAKWLATKPSVLILDEPTHGIDVGTKVQVHRIITQLAEQGLSVLLISSDLPEILAMSDRILVISEGLQVAEFSRHEATQENIMFAASNISKAHKL